MLIDRRDLLYAVRSMRRDPVMTFVVVLTLAIGIGLNAGIFTFLNFLCLQPPVKNDPSSFVQIYPRYDGWFTGADQFSSFTIKDYEAISTQAHSLAEVAAWQSTQTMLDDAHQRNSSILVTCNYFRVYGFNRPLLGRFFVPDECKLGTASQVAVLSEHCWKNFYEADPHILGKVIHISHQPVTVVGIASDSSVNRMPGGVWMPYTLRPLFEHRDNISQNPDWPWLTVVGRLKQEYSRAGVKAELTTILRRQDRLYLARETSTLDRKTSLVLTNGSFIQNPAVRSKGIALMGLIMGPLTLVLLLACINVAMVFLSRSIPRRGEIAIRLALGLGRARLLRMLAIESFSTAALGGIISICLAYRAPVLITGVFDPIEAKSASLIQPDWTVFGYLAALVLMATMVSALAPMRESLRLDLVSALKGRGGGATMRSGSTNALVIVQLAMSFVLLSAAVVFGRIPSMMTGIDPGFEMRQVMIVPLDISIPPYTRTSALAFCDAVEARIEQVPGVESFAYASLRPFRQAPPSEVLLANQSKGQGLPASVDDVSSDFFSTFGIPIMRGRGFLPSDVSATSRASIAVVSRTFASVFFGNNDPIGKPIVTADGRHLVVVGVAGDTRSERYGVVDRPRLYTLRDPQSLDGQLFVRFYGSAASVSASINDVVKSLDSNQLETPLTIWASLESDAGIMRSLAKIIFFTAGIAILMAITGVYGVLSFAINQRTPEFGIQMALGATPGSVFRSVMVRGFRQLIIALFCGMALAIPAAWTVARLVKNSPLHVKAFDLSTYSISALVLLAVALPAMYLPARRATKVDPIKALRNE